jgi:enoyl-[acyl-carrier protein] reductase I
MLQRHFALCLSPISHSAPPPQSWHASGATLSIGISSDRFRPALEKATAGWAVRPHIVSCDVGSDASLAEAWQAIAAAHGGRLHHLAHSIAYASPAAMKGAFLDITREDFRHAHDISAYSLVALARGALPLMEAAGAAGSAAGSAVGGSAAAAGGGEAGEAARRGGGGGGGGSILSLSYLGAARAADTYRVMGPAKASLEAASRQLALELGRRGVRVNVISAGPVDTLAARGIQGFSVSGERVGAVGEWGREVYRRGSATPRVRAN